MFVRVRTPTPCFFVTSTNAGIPTPIAVGAKP